ncbi:MAG: flagellar biosynthesis regulator FlhF [Sporolactobacillus sp.]|jgi:flagellar biosynthesis protein FlhF|nr:flagellar biosynthesis regulator FlhF [Sporolactobacillus sp.]
MKMKKITAPTMSLALEKVKRELGSDAVIFRTRKVTNGRFFNLIKKQQVEVLAGVDTETDTLFKKQMETAEKTDDRAAALHRPDFGHGISVNVHKWLAGPKYVEKLHSRLIVQDLQVEDADDLAQTLVKKWYQADEHLDEAEMVRLLKAELIRRLRPARFLKSIPAAQRYVMFVGPTGVGKTTTIAKLAGKEVLEGGKKVAFISLDTFRIAAIGQLQTYAEILNVPMDVAYTRDEFRLLVDKYATYDRVYIDTAGRNFQDASYVDEIRRLTDGLAPINLCLVLAATARYTDLQLLIRHFERLAVNELIISKVDETATCGAIVSLLLHVPHKQILYITNGQNVPDDLLAADAGRLTARMLGEEDEQ